MTVPLKAGANTTKNGKYTPQNFPAGISLFKVNEVVLVSFLLILNSLLVYPLLTLIKLIPTRFANFKYFPFSKLEKKANQFPVSCLFSIHVGVVQ